MPIGVTNFPASLDSKATLVEARNNASTTLAASANVSVTTFTVADTSSFPNAGIIRIGNELVAYDSKTSDQFLQCTRQYENTVANSYSVGTPIYLLITAASNNVKGDAIIELEKKVGTGSSTPIANTVLRGTGTGTSAYGQVGLTTDVTGTLPVANGGTGITSLGANVATFLGTPSSENLASAVTGETGSGALVFGTTPTISRPTIDNPSLGYTTTALTGGTTTLTNTSNFRQFFTGSTGGHILVLPVASTMVLGQGFEIHNNGTASLSVQSSGNNTIANVQGGQSARITCILTSGTGTSSWDLEITGGNDATGTGLLVFNSQPSLTLPAIGSSGFTLAGSGGGITTIVTSATGDGTVTIPAGTATLATTQNAMAFKNLLINGDMRIDQRNAGGLVTINSSGNRYTIDRWFAAGQTSDGVFTVQRSTTAPTGFQNSFIVTVTTADTSISSGQAYSIGQSVEGFNSAKLLWGTANAKSVTLSFWVRSSIAATFGGAIRNGSGNRSYPFTYTISAANTFEYKTITIPGDTSGTWATDNTLGLQLWFSLGTGSALSGPAGAWNGNNNISATGAASLLGTLNATFYISGVQMEEGLTATSYEYLPFNVQLAQCQRYYEKSFSSTTAPAENLQTADSYGASTRSTLMAGALTYLHTWFLQEKRSTPSMLFFNPGPGAAANVNLDGGAAAGSAQAVNISVRGLMIGFPGGTTVVSAGTYYIHWTANSEL